MQSSPLEGSVVACVHVVPPSVDLNSTVPPLGVVSCNTPDGLAAIVGSPPYTGSVATD
jgi:hypothetical protein